jgi:tetratricopeptide (TPR) repeat protein
MRALAEADACIRSGRYQDAVALLEPVAARVGGEERAAVLTSLAAARSQLGDYGAAERELVEAIELRAAALGDDHPDTAITRHTLAESYRHTGRVGEALPLYLSVLETRSRHPDDPRALATALFGVGQCFFTQGDLTRADTAHRRALALRTAALPAHPDERAESLLGLGAVLHARGDAAEAEAELVQAVAAYRAIGATHPRLAVALNELGGLDLYLGRFADAEPRFAEALAITRRTLPDRHPDLAPLLGNLLECRLQRGAAAEALDLSLEACAIDDTVVAELLALGPDRTRVELGERAQRDVDGALSLALQEFAGDPRVAGRMLDLVLRRKAITLEAAGAQRKALRSGDRPALQAQLEELAQVRRSLVEAALAPAMPEPAIAAHRRRVTDLEQRRDALEARLARSLPALDLELRLRSTDRHAVAAALPADSALVEYVRHRPRAFGAVASRGEPDSHPERYAAFVLPAGEPDAVVLEDLGPAERIDALARTFLEAVAGTSGRAVSTRPAGAGASASAGTDLRACVLDPLLGATAGATHLVLAPVGPLAQLPFEVLPSGDGRLIDTHLVSYVDVGRDVLRFGGERPEDAAPPLVLAGPDYGPAPAGEPGFRALDGAAAEGRSVARRLGVDAVEGPDAGKERAHAAPAPWVLHLATHGFFLVQPPITAIVDGVAERRSAGAGQVSRIAVLDDPMLRSGVALAGANEGDGLLTAADLAGLDLDATELVVLSACDTGRGDPSRSEGVFGLRRAFALSGARTVVISLWKVPDDDTRELMELFYDALFEPGLPRAEALRQAQRTLAARRPDQPFRWGAFICQGDPSPMPPRPAGRR